MHFFIEHTQIANETSRFGPDLNNPATKYNVTTQFSLNGKTKAFACQKGKIIVLPSSANNTLVNIILQPIENLNIPFSKIQYYVYKGILKNSFFSGTGINPKAETNTDFIKKLWDSHKKWKTANPDALDPTPSILGFIDDASQTPKVEDIFNGDVTGFTSQKVEEGEWIGDFDQSCSFEIVINTDNLSFDVNYLKPNKQIFDVSSFPILTPSDQFKLRIEREKVLNYIDPAAFWGMHYETGITIYDSAAANNKRKIKGVDLYHDLISKYSTKNRVYLDIRSEYGYSYNFYQNYQDSTPGKSNLKFKTNKDLSYLNHKYERDWHIFYDDGGNIEPHDYSSYFIQIRVDDNSKPLVFFRDKKISPNTKRPCFISEKELLDGTSTEWTKDIELRFPNFNNSGMRIYVANYLQIQYFRQADNPASPPGVLQKTGYLEKGIKLLPAPQSSKFKHKTLMKRGFLTGNNFAYVLENGTYYDAEKFVLYTKNIASYVKSTEVYPKIDFSTETPDELMKSSPLFPKQILFNKWQAAESSSVKIDILEILGFNKASQTTYFEDIFLLGLTKTEFDTLSSLSGLNDFHSKLILLKEVPNQKDFNNNIPYKKFSLEIQGLDDEGAAKIIKPAADQIFVYGTSLNILCSRDFAAASDLPNLLPDPGTMKEFYHVGRFDYDSNDPIVTTKYRTKVR